MFCVGNFDITPEDKGALISTDVSFECEVTQALGQDEDLQFFKVKIKKTAFNCISDLNDFLLGIEKLFR